MANSKALIQVAQSFLQAIGENPEREGLLETPLRMAKMWQEVFCGYDPAKKPKITIFPNGKDGIVYDEMIISEGYFYSHCEHHGATFFGSWFFGYIPNEYIMGASKIDRLVDYHAARLQVQERLVLNIIDDIVKSVCPSGCGLVMRGRHLCREMRGVKKTNTIFETTALRGSFKESKATRDEFLSRIQR